MFYSHEILTQRKYGVATIWLVATLGSKSGLKKVLRKDILGVNVPKACATVMQPDAPLALRLQSNLLYGISRVYSGQCDYLMNDASMAHSNIKRMITATIRAANLDLTSGGKARPEHLVLTDDPAFLPDLNLTQLPDGIDLDIDGHGTVFNLGDSIGISSMSFDMDNSVQHFSNVVSRVGSALGTPRVVDPMIATSDTMVGDYGFIPGPGLADEGDRFLDDIDFEFDADGEMRDLPMPPSEGDSMVGGRVASVGLSRRRRAGSVQSIGRGSRMGSEEAAAQVLREHEEGRDRSYGAGLTLNDDDNFYAPPEDNRSDVPDGAKAPQDNAEYLPVALGSSTDKQTEDLEDIPAQRRRGPRATTFIIDSKTELRNAEMKGWRDNYLLNMGVALKRSQARKASRMAKGNANILVFEYGFFGTLKNPILKNLFSAKALLETINGGVEGFNKRKRAAGALGAGGDVQELDGEDGEGRRIRARMEHFLGPEGETGLGDPQDEYELPMNQPDEDGLEVAREGPEGMSDGVRPSSTAAFPWNIMSDHAGRSRAGSIMSGGVLLPSGGGFPSSSMGGSQIGSQIGQMDFAARRASRHSAIRGGMERLSVLGSPIGERDEEAVENFGQEFPAPGEEMEFEYFGAGANVDTQTAQDSQWLAATVEQESTNFFEFLKTEHTKCKQRAEDEGEEPASFITFEQLLDPAQNGKIVAAQAFHHTLLLATKGLIYVSQEESYGSIQIGIF